MTQPNALVRKFYPEKEDSIWRLEIFANSNYKRYAPGQLSSAILRQSKKQTLWQKFDGLDVLAGPEVHFAIRKQQIGLKYEELRDATAPIRWD